MILRVKHGVNYGLWVIMMCQCTLNKRTTAVRDVDSGGGLYVCEGWDIWEISVSSHFL